MAAIVVALSAALPDSQALPTVFAAIACGLSSLAALLAYAAWRSASENKSGLLSLARALDQSQQGRNKPATAPDLDTIALMVAREVERVAASLPSPPSATGSASTAPGEQLSMGTNVEPLIRPSGRRPIQGKMPLVADALAEGRLDIALRPVVSLSQGIAAAFDAVAEFATPGEPPFHLARLHVDAPLADRARFESLLLACAIDATRRVVAGSTDAPLHVPVSRALLDTGDDTIVERLRAHGRAARAIILDLAAADLLVRGGAPAMLDHLIDAGVGLCVDVSGELAPDLAKIRMCGARQIRLPASRLLGHTASRGRGMNGADIAAAGREAGIVVIADDVATDEEALSLVDLGVDLMSGARFSGPRRLRDAGSTQASRTAAE